MLLVLAVVLGAMAPLRAQVVTPMELSDPKAQRLQQRHLQTLMAIGTEIEAHKFPYPFYFSRVLDVDLAKMQLADQRSIRFDTYKGQTVLEITGNYYAAYSADRMDSYARLKETFERVVMPILQAEVPHFPDDSEFSAFAIEVSHHVRQKVMGVSSEQPENVTVIIPVPVAQKLVDAKTDDQKQGGHPGRASVSEWPALFLMDAGRRSLRGVEGKVHALARSEEAARRDSERSDEQASAVEHSVRLANLMKTSPTTMRILTPESLALLAAPEPGRHRPAWSRASTTRRTSLLTRRRPSSAFAKVLTCNFPSVLHSKRRRELALQAGGAGLR